MMAESRRDDNVADKNHVTVPQSHGVKATSEPCLRVTRPKREKSTTSARPGHSGRKSRMDSLYVNIHRCLYTMETLRRDYPPLSRPSWRSIIRESCRCSRECVIRKIVAFVPIFTVIRRYKRENVVLDLLAGMSTAFLHLPQGLGFGILAGLNPIHGLNTTFFSIVFYLIFGTSHHVSYGTSSIPAIFTSAIIDKELQKEKILLMAANKTQSPEENLSSRVHISTAVTLIMGITLLTMGICRLGCVANYLAVSFIAGLTFAASIHIVTAQVPKMFNLKIPVVVGAGKVIRIYTEVFKNIADTNLADFTIFAISTVIILLVVIFVNEKYKEKMKAPVPIDLIVLLTGTFICYYAELDSRFSVAVVGKVPSGFPDADLPNVRVIPDILQESFIVTLLSFALTIALAKHCSKIHDYELDVNQELVAYGLVNILNSFLQTFPACNSPPRAMMLSSLHSQTTLNGLPAAIIILVVLLAAGPLFSSLPISLLGAMMAVGMKDLLLQFRSLPYYWRVSKTDFVIWIFTAGVGTLVDLDYGIIAGILVSFITVVVFNQVAAGSLMGFSKREDLIMVGDKRVGVTSLPGLTIFHFNSQLFFANAEFFKEQIYSKVYNPARHNPAFQDEYDGICNKVHYILLDCSAMTYIDIAGLNVLKVVITQYSSLGSTVLLSGCPDYMMEVLTNAEFFDHFNPDHLFFSEYDAFTWAKSRLEMFERVGLYGMSSSTIGIIVDRASEEEIPNEALADELKPVISEDELSIAESLNIDESDLWA